MVSSLDLFSVGIGPSSSHTVGPMRAAKAFADDLHRDRLIDRVTRVQVTLYGSLALTGRGHGTDRAVLAGLEGYEPETVNPDHVTTGLDEAIARASLLLEGTHRVVFQRADIVFNLRHPLPLHPNGMRFQAFDAAGECFTESVMYSTGGGFIATQAQLEQARESGPADDSDLLPYPFSSARELLDLCQTTHRSIAEIMWVNETALRIEQDVRDGLLHIWAAMRECVAHGCTATQAVLPGILRVPRRAPGIYRRLAGERADLFDPTGPGLQDLRTRPGCLVEAAQWVDLFALAVNEENASGGRIVTAPTNGAAGIIPAVLHYYWGFIDGASEQGVIDFLLTASAIGILFKRNASISGAEVGCQGEVGSACSMAAAGICAVLGGTPAQVENAAEIGIEHNLGLTCDPVEGLVQIPCIERNAIASNTAINAARVAMLGDGTHIVSLDQAIETMRQTGADMMEKYKETSRGGLAVTVRTVEC